MIELKENCLCGSQTPYSLCCQPLHDNIKKPDTAERLMRSRFTAYAMHNDQYLMETWSLVKRPKNIDFSKDDAVWTTLEIIKTKKGGLKDSKGIVEFKAYYTSHGHGCGFLSADFLPIAALLKQLRSLLCASFIALLSTKISSL